MLPTLALALSLAAPVPKVAPFPLRTDPLPKEFKLADLEEAAEPQEVKGTVSLLAWETVENDSPMSVTRVMVLKKLDKADTEGNQYTLTYMYRRPKETGWQYRYVRVSILAALSGDETAVSTAYRRGYQDYAKPPTDKEFATFLKDVRWAPKLGQEVATFLDGKRVITTKLTAGGIDRDAWKMHFDRDPPVELFAELKEEKK